MSMMRKYKIGNYDLLLSILMVALTIGYVFDAVTASTEVVNLIFIVPVAAGILVLSGSLILKEILSSKKERDRDDDDADLRSVYKAMALFVGYVGTLGWLGFDVGTAVFIGSSLWVQGVRKPLAVFAFSSLLGFGLAAFFQFMLPYPMPMLLL